MSPSSQLPFTFEEINELTDAHILPTYKRLPIAFVKGQGARLWDTEGKEYLDFLTGFAVCGLGHCHPRVVEAIQEQAETLLHTSNIFHIAPQAQLAKLLSELTGGKKSFFANSGAEVNEAAIKLARRYAHLRRSISNPEIIVAEGSFHGRTLAALTATGQEKYHEGFEPLLPGFKYVPFNDLEALNEVVDDETCAIMMEPIQGEIGVREASEEYLRGIEEICREREILLILDEIQTGLGRTGKMFAYEHFGVIPDIITLAKSLAGGVPIGVMLAEPDLADLLQPGSHASTFGGNFLATAAGIAALTALREERIVENAARVGDFFKTKLLELKERFSAITEVRGKGLMLAIQLEAPLAQAIQEGCRKRGLIINAIGEDIIRFLPPLIVSQEEVEQACSILEESLAESLAASRA